MEKKVELADLQNQIFRLINGIKTSKKTKEHFLGIVSVLSGRNSENYEKLKQLIEKPILQLELLQGENDECHDLFMVYCHTALESYIEQTSPETPQDEDELIINTPEKDWLLHEYFSEMEKATQHRLGLIGFNLRAYPNLHDKEYMLLRRLLKKDVSNASLAEYTYNKANYRQLLTAWFMYPKLIFYPEEVEKVIKLFTTGELEI